MSTTPGFGWLQVPPPPPLSEVEKLALLSLARAEVERVVTGGPPGTELPGDLENGALKLQAGIFVTLYRDGGLRGCIGLFQTRNPLWQTAREMAAAAATRDPRFEPVEPGEIPSLRIEISVLGDLVPVPLDRRDQEASFLKPGEHGVYLRQGERSGLLLPQVAERWGWDGDRFLRETCLKAGLPEEAWLSPRTDILLFRVFKFGEISEEEAVQS